MSSPKDLLLRGTALLDRQLEQHGFKLEPTDAAKGSGGHFAVGRYSNGDRSITLHVRHALGIIEYRWGDHVINHSDYMTTLGVRDKAAYPGFSDDPLDSFRHLLSDLHDYCGDFLSGSRPEVFAEHTARARQSGFHRQRLP